MHSKIHLKKFNYFKGLQTCPRDDLRTIEMLSALGGSIDSSYESLYTHKMSKRMQILVPDAEYKEVLRITKNMGTSVADWVRDLISEGIQKRQRKSADAKIAAVLRYAKFKGPTGSIDQILKEIDEGRHS